jgi:carboxyl-terminal processing protease
MREGRIERRTRLLASVLVAALPMQAAAQVAAVPPKTVVASPAPMASFDSAWSAVSRTYWDTTLVNGRWRASRDSLRAALGAQPDDDAVRAAIRALIALPKQSHFVLLPASAAPIGGRVSQEPGTVGIEVRPLDGAIIAWRVDADGAAYRAGVRAGDRLVQLDSSVLDSVQARLRAASATDTAAADRLLATFTTARLGGNAGDDLRLQFLDATGARRAVVLARTPVQGTVSRYGNLPPFVVNAEATRVPVSPGSARAIAVVRFNGWFPVLSPALDSIFFANRDAAGLILDLRGNPGGVIGMIAGISGHMLDTAVSLGELKSRSGVIRFSANPRRVDPRGTRTPPFAGPIAILVDEFSASTSEFFATGMQALGRARVFGTRSAGQALPAAMGRLPNGDVLMHVIADHVDPRGRRVEGVGVVPDTFTPLALVDIRAGRDAALDAARTWIAAGAR